MLDEKLVNIVEQTSRETSPCVSPSKSDISKRSNKALASFRNKENSRISSTPVRKNSSTSIKQKVPLVRKSSNISTDSGQYQFSDKNENISEHSFKDETESRRHSITFIDSTGHLHVPNHPDSISSSTETNVRTSSSPTLTPRNSNSPVDADTGYASNSSPCRHAPRILYSHSEDGTSCTNIDRSGQYSLPYLPYGSPSTSPRLRRQPTMETRRVSVSEGDGYTQLNQYKLKDEIGKVSSK